MRAVCLGECSAILPRPALRDNDDARRGRGGGDEKEERMGESGCAIAIGSMAERVLRLRACRSTVLAPVRGAVYLETEGGEILWVVESRAGLHRRAILVSRMPSYLPPVGEPCVVEDGSLRVGTTLAIDLRNAQVWRGGRVAGRIGEVDEAAERLAEGIRRLVAEAPVRGELTRLVLASEETEDRGGREAVSGGAIGAVRRGVDALRRIAPRRGLRAALEEAEGLVGLGGGLTPSGDDFLGGFLFTLRCLGPDVAGAEPESVDEWIQSVKARTTRISHAVLADLAVGEAAEPLAELLRSALAGLPVDPLARLALRVSEVGHSSGWETLAGVACACAEIGRRARSEG